MDKNTRNSIQRATQAARKLIEEAYREQLEGTYDILLEGSIADKPGDHLSDRQKVTREKLVAAVAHKRSSGLKAKEAVDAYLREAAFTTLNRFVALKMLEARKLVQECVSKGENSIGFTEFAALAPGLVTVEDKGYRLYIEMLFDEIGQEVKVLFDRRDVASLLWPDRQTLLDLLGILNAPELASVWAEDETIGWVYQYFNGDEERSKMRAESQAPRNSRELAVRNQFFTPRYVVQFLTDNTLGRTWYEMMQGESKLAHLDYLVRRPNEVFLAEGESAPESEVDESELSQEELLRQTVYVPFRARKDPRDLCILDPACGSGHFLLYAFDLLTTIYEEAWTDVGSAAFTETGTPLRDDYSSIEELRRAMPEFILRQNLHGVDIEPRAAQIAALALWMRAQRAYNEFDMGRADRPPITKTNIVVAEPMPGDAELVDEFAASLKPAVLGDLFKKMVEEMKLAGELGSLLKIEESIAKAVKEAAEANQQGSLFAEKVESQDFWDTADEKIIAALGSFAESAAGAGGVRRQLFAGDAAQGVAFIELMRKRFDAVLMNPPFGSASSQTEPYIASCYPSWNKNLVCAFVDAWQRRRAITASIGVVLDETALVKSTYAGFRTSLMSDKDSGLIGVDLGWDVLDANVEVAVLVLGGSNPSPMFASVGNEPTDGKAASLIARARRWPVQDIVPYDAIAAFPNGAFPFSVPPEVLRVFAEHASLERQVGESSVQGHSLKSQEHFRAYWEAPLNMSDRDSEYVPLYNGGSHSYYASPYRESCKYGGARGALKSPNVVLRNLSKQQKAGVGWGKRGDYVDTHVLPAGCVFTVEGQGFPLTNKRWLALAFLNSGVFSYLVNTYCGQHKYSGYVNVVPFPTLSDHADDHISLASRACWENVAALWSLDETSVFFETMGLASAQSAQEWAEQRCAEAEQRAEQVRAGRSLIERELVGAFGCSDALKHILSEWSRAEPNVSDTGPWTGDTTAPSFWANRLLSIAFGVLLERWSIDAVFDPRGVVSADAAFEPPPGNAKFIRPIFSSTTASVVVDDAGHADDLLKKVEGVNGLQQVMVEACLLVGRPNLRNWLGHAFFSEHVDAYTRGKRGGLFTGSSPLHPPPTPSGAITTA